MQSYSVMSQHIGMQGKDGIFQRFDGEENEITKNHRKYNNHNENNMQTYELFHADNVLADKNFTFYNGS